MLFTQINFFLTWMSECMISIGNSICSNKKKVVDFAF